MAQITDREFFEQYPTDSETAAIHLYISAQNLLVTADALAKYPKDPTLMEAASTARHLAQQKFEFAAELLPNLRQLS